MQSELTQWTKWIGKIISSPRPRLAFHDNEKPVDNYMTNLWISRDENVKSSEPHAIHEIRPQGYPRGVLNYFKTLSDTIHGIHRYNSIKQQLYYYIYLGRNAV
jgi:hypothetical protein